MHLYGFGFPSQGFHCLKLPGVTKSNSDEHVGVLKISSGDADARKVEEELKHLIDASWAWNVKRITDSEYIATFPNKMILDTLSRSSGVTLAKYNLTATVSKSSMNPMASSMLQTGWIQMMGVLGPTRNVEAATLIAELAGEVLAIDEVSLIRDGPVRAKIRARQLSKVRGLVEIFIAGVGYEIKFLAEKKGSQQDTKGPPPPPPPPKNPDDEFFEDDEDYVDSEWEDSYRGRGSKSQKSEAEQARSLGWGKTKHSGHNDTKGED
ncbi:hypothetical protein C2845_PM13G04790 [Panicum miliaceum]|uniref:DUF4283 domain-containing protein n=1 Tax=Panicum miliaceum TaxID=4540 RepID=A0A3L6RGE7_PANMI|nr:hypothetical protein C2845_PM13G04790 [Panicum miliaceum]